VGDGAWWDSDEKTLRCLDCGDPEDDRQDPADTHGVAGGSAQREADRRSQRREDRIRAAHPRIGGLLLAAFADPQSTRAWSEGAEGERKVGRRLDTMQADGVIVLHDRRIPGRRSNIDHLVVAPSGVWVVDTKRYRGKVERRDIGGWFRRADRLYVAGRDRTVLVEQVLGARAVVAEAVDHGPVRPALCFVDGDWGLFTRPFEINGVLIGWPKALVAAIERPGEFADRVPEMADRLARAFPPA